MDSAPAIAALETISAVLCSSRHHGNGPLPFPCRDYNMNEKSSLVDSIMRSCRNSIPVSHGLPIYERRIYGISDPSSGRDLSRKGGYSPHEARSQSGDTSAICGRLVNVELGGPYSICAGRVVSKQAQLSRSICHVIERRATFRGKYIGASSQKTRNRRGGSAENTSGRRRSLDCLAIESRSTLRKVQWQSPKNLKESQGGARGETKKALAPGRDIITETRIISS